MHFPGERPHKYVASFFEGQFVKDDGVLWKYHHKEEIPWKHGRYWYIYYPAKNRKKQ